jgi:hypothetical protein
VGGIAIVIGSLLGCAPLTVYIESASGEDDRLSSPAAAVNVKSGAPSSTLCCNVHCSTGYTELLPLRAAHHGTAMSPLGGTPPAHKLCSKTCTAARIAGLTGVFDHVLQASVREGAPASRRWWLPLASL